MKYFPARIAHGPNMQPLVNEGQPMRYVDVLDMVLSTTSPKPEDRLAAYRIMQVLAKVPPGADVAFELELEIKQVELLLRLALECPSLTTLGYGVLHDWLEGKDDRH